MFLSQTDQLQSRRMVALNGNDGLEKYFVQSYIHNLYSYDMNNIAQRSKFVKNMLGEDSEARQYVQSRINENIKNVNEGGFGSCIISDTYKIQPDIYRVSFFTIIYDKSGNNIFTQYQMDLFFDMYFDDSLVFKVRQLNVV